MNVSLFITLGVVYSLIITLPFILSYWSLNSFLESLINKDYKNAKRKLSKDKIIELIFSEEKIKYYAFKKLEDLDKMNYSLSLFYITLGLLLLVLYFVSIDNKVYLELFSALLYTFLGITITIFIYYLVKIWLSVKIVNNIIKLDEIEITYLKEIQEEIEKDKGEE